MNNREFNQSLSDNFEKETYKLKNKWALYISNKSVILKKLVDEKSYFIDDLIKNDVLKDPNGELLAKELMTLSRFERRITAIHIYETVEKYQDREDYLARLFVKHNNIGFLFIYYPIERPPYEIDIILKKAMELYSYFHKSEKIVLLAATKGLKQWKFALFEALPVTVEIEKKMKEWADSFGWFKNERKRERFFKEYPDEK